MDDYYENHGMAEFDRILIRDMDDYKARIAYCSVHNNSWESVDAMFDEDDPRRPHCPGELIDIPDD